MFMLPPVLGFLLAVPDQHFLRQRVIHLVFVRVYSAFIYLEIELIC